MKKIVALSALIASINLGGLPAANAAESSGAANIAGSQVRVQTGQQRRNRNWRNNRSRVRTETRTRIVRIGRQVYRETYQIRYLPNGRTQTRLISRVRIR